MEDDPFSFIVECCQISSSQEEILRSWDNVDQDESLGPPGPAINSTGVFMISPPASTQHTRNSSHSPRETYHTPPEVSAPPSVRAVDLGADTEVGSDSGTVRDGPHLPFKDPCSNYMDESEALKRGPDLEEPLPKKPRYSDANVGSRDLSAPKPETTKFIVTVNTLNVFTSFIGQEIEDNLIKLFEGFKDHNSNFRRVLSEYEEPSVMVKLPPSALFPSFVNLTLKKPDNVFGEKRNSSEKSGDSLEVNGADRSNAEVIASDVAQVGCRREVGNAADITDSTYKGGKEFPLSSLGKTVAHSKEIRDGEKLKAQAHADREGRRSDVERFMGDPGPKDTGRDNTGSQIEASAGGTSAFVEQPEDSWGLVHNLVDAIELMDTAGKDPCIQDKGKAIDLSCDDTEAQNSAFTDIQKDMDGLGLNENSQDVCVNGKKSGESSDVNPASRRFVSCAGEPAQNMQDRASSGDSFRPPETRRVDILNVLRMTIEACETPRQEEAGFFNIARNFNLSFSFPNPQGPGNGD